MAQFLGVFHWFNEPLDAEVPYRNGDIIVVDSDVDDSPSTKADRKRRREAIGQRYLLGHVPFVQSASLQGPFGLDSGWVNPWKHVRPSQPAHPHSAVPKTENVIIDLAEADDQTLEETCRYDTDIEIEVVEAFYEDYHSVRNANDVDLPGLKLTPLPFDNDPSCFGNDDEDPVMLQPTLHPMTGCQLKGDPRRHAHLEQENGKKRNADTGWLKGRNIAKRSRHVVLDHSSPTPVGGFRQTADKRTKLQSFSTMDAVGKLRGRDASQEVQSKDIHHARVDGNMTKDALEILPVTDGPFTFDENYERQNVHDLVMQKRPSPEGDAIKRRGKSMNDISSVHGIQEMEQKLERSSSDNNTEHPPEGEYPTDSISTASRNGRSTALIYEGNFDDLDLDDTHGLDQASRLAIAGARLDLAAETSKSTKLDTLELSSSEMSSEDFRSIRNAQRLSRGETLFGTDLANHQSPNQSFLPLSMAPEIRDEMIVGLEDIITLSNTPSPASEQSFQYRRTNRRSKSCRISAISGEKQTPWRGDHDEAGITYGSRKSDGHIHGNTTISSSFVDEGITKVGVLVDRKYQKKRRKRQTLSEPNGSSPGTRLETVETSSPDPLSEGFRGSSQARFTPSNNGQIMVDELARNSLQGLKENLDHNQAGMAQLDPTTDGIGVKRRNTQRPEPENFEGYLDMSVSPSSPLGPRLPKLGTGLESPRADLESSRKPSEPQLLFDDIQASLHPNPQDERVAANLWPRFARSNLHTPYDMVLNPSPEHSRGARTTSQDPHILKHTPRPTDSKAPVVLSNSKQSPWAVTGVEAVGRTRSSISTTDEIFYDEVEDQTWLHERDLEMIDDAQRTFFEGGRQSMVGKTHIDQEADSPKSPTSKRDLSEAVLPFTSFPSTQVLVKATTDNPWNSAIKRSSSANIRKNVSFSSLPDSVCPSTYTEDRTHFMSPPPPPPESVHLTDSDDPFDYRPMATKAVEVNKKSPTKPANTQRINLHAMECRAKLPPPSPAVGAMAEAFIAADKQILRKISGDTDKATPSQLSSMDYQDVKNSGYSSRSGLQKPRVRSSSPFDGSFTIAPNGKLTAVNVDVSGYDAEANLANVIEEMGSIFEGWDIDAELKKAKGNGSEKSRDTKGRRQRGYLSGVSNL